MEVFLSILRILTWHSLDLQIVKHAFHFMSQPTIISRMILIRSLLAIDFQVLATKFLLVRN
jgi:hypothetical protein